MWTGNPHSGWGPSGGGGPAKDPLRWGPQQGQLPRRGDDQVGEGCRISSKAPNAAGAGEAGRPCTCVEAAIVRTEASRRYARTHTHTCTRARTTHMYTHNTQAHIHARTGVHTCTRHTCTVSPTAHTHVRVFTCMYTRLQQPWATSRLCFRLSSHRLPSASDLYLNLKDTLTQRHFLPVSPP